MEALDDLIGAILGTRSFQPETAAARAHQKGLGYDPRRLELFEALHIHLMQAPPPRPQASGRTRSPPYPSSRPISRTGSRAPSSSWTQAEEIVFEGMVPQARFEDAHDVLGTFELVDDADLRARVPAAPRICSTCCARTTR